MGLDTTHGCWHGSYSSFMEWRVKLHAAITGEPATRDALKAAWMSGRYDDQSVPINVLMNHSDCDDEIPADICLPLAVALESLMPTIPDDAEPFGARWRAVRFAAGLRRAAAAGEPVEFH